MGWICPHCGTTATLQKSDTTRGWNYFAIPTAPDTEGIAIYVEGTRCPSNSCGRYVVDVKAYFGEATRTRGVGGGLIRTGDVKPDIARPFGIGSVRFEPRVGLPLSNLVPVSVRKDYEEAYLIKDLSPKASATLCRRALQGVIRDFWGVTKNSLHDELLAIQPKCDPELYDAMMSLKSIGNIGAHPEKDINIIVEIDEGEPDTLLEVIRILDKEWYVARADRASRLTAISKLAQEKAAARGATGAASPAPPVAP